MKQADLVEYNVGGLTDAADWMPPASVDIVFTDPPYHLKHLHLYAQAAGYAARVLRPGGTLLAMAGRVHPDHIGLLTGSGLDYLDTIAVEMSGGTNSVHWPSRTSAGWKPVYRLARPGGTPGPLVRNLVYTPPGGEKAGRYHRWGQATAVAYGVIRRFTNSNKGAYRRPVVADPMCGGGAFVIAALQAGASKVYASDVDPEAVETTRRRVTESGWQPALPVAAGIPIDHDEQALVGEWTGAADG